MERTSPIIHPGIIILVRQRIQEMEKMLDKNTYYFHKVESEYKSFTLASAI